MHPVSRTRIEGRYAEQLFYQTARSRGWFVSKCSVYQNMNDHIDFVIQNKRGTYNIDVKAQKRQQRNMQQQSDWIAVEFVGVTYPASNVVNFSHKIFDPANPLFDLGSGRAGWVYGKADFIAFHIDDEFWMTPRLKLLELCINTVDFRTLVQHSVDAKYRPFSRQDRGDLISYVHKEDVEPISTKWPTSSFV